MPNQSMMGMGMNMQMPTAMGVGVMNSGMVQQSKQDAFADFANFGKWWSWRAQITWQSGRGSFSLPVHCWRIMMSCKQRWLEKCLNTPLMRSLIKNQRLCVHGCKSENIHEPVISLICQDGQTHTEACWHQLDEWASKRTPVGFAL